MTYLFIVKRAFKADSILYQSDYDICYIFTDDLITLNQVIRENNVQTITIGNVGDYYNLEMDNNEFCKSCDPENDPTIKCDDGLVEIEFNHLRGIQSQDNIISSIRSISH